MNCPVYLTYYERDIFLENLYLFFASMTLFLYSILIAVMREVIIIVLKMKSECDYEISKYHSLRDLGLW